MTYEAIRYELADHVATVTLDRPDVHNAMNNAMRHDTDFTRIVYDSGLLRGEFRQHGLEGSSVVFLL